MQANLGRCAVQSTSLTKRLRCLGGKELSKIVYSKNGTVYLAGRSKEKADRAIEEIKQAHPSSDGCLEFLHVDLADLVSILTSSADPPR